MGTKLVWRVLAWTWKWLQEIAGNSASHWTVGENGHNLIFLISDRTAKRPPVRAINNVRNILATSFILNDALHQFTISIEEHRRLFKNSLTLYRFRVLSFRRSARSSQFFEEPNSVEFESWVIGFQGSQTTICVEMIDEFPLFKIRLKAYKKRSVNKF